MAISLAVFPLKNPQSLSDDINISRLAEWVLENPGHSRHMQEKIIDWSGHISLTGYEILWGMLGGMDGWKDTLWKGIAARKHPTKDCIELIKKSSSVLSTADMYSWLHEKMSERSQPSALLLSQNLSTQAAHVALFGVWAGADLLMGRIVGQYAQRQDMAEGKYSWWEMAAVLLERGMESQARNLMESGLLRGAVLRYISILEKNQHLAKQDNVDCGRVFSKAVELDEYTYLPLLDAWIGSGGNWKGLDGTAHGPVRQALDRHPTVRRERLMGLVRPGQWPEREQPRKI